jgi:hypothetical protein
MVSFRSRLLGGLRYFSSSCLYAFLAEVLQYSFMGQQEPFLIQSATETHQVTICTDNPMTGDNYRDRVPVVGLTHCPHSLWFPDLFRDFFVACRLSKRDLT